MSRSINRLNVINLTDRPKQLSLNQNKLSYIEFVNAYSLISHIHPARLIFHEKWLECLWRNPLLTFRWWFLVLWMKWKHSKSLQQCTPNLPSIVTYLSCKSIYIILNCLKSFITGNELLCRGGVVDRCGRPLTPLTTWFLTYYLGSH